jgi:hypothetical protein
MTLKAIRFNFILFVELKVTSSCFVLKELHSFDEINGSKFSFDGIQGNKFILLMELKATIPCF